MSHQKLNRFRSGSGTMLFGVFFMVTFFAFIMMFAEMYSMQDNYLNTKAATDTIADGTALYAMRHSAASASDVAAKANEIAGVVAEETGASVDTLSLDEGSLKEDYTVTVSTSTVSRHVTDYFGAVPLSIRTESATKFLAWDLNAPVAPGPAGTTDTNARLQWLFDGNVPSSAAEMQQWLTTITVPVTYLDGSRGTMFLTVHKKLADEYIGAFEDMASIGFPINTGDTYCYGWRSMVSSSSQSHHSYGSAIDVNAGANPMIGYTGSASGYNPGTDPYAITPVVVAIWKSHGFYWGGEWNTSKDYMHFTYCNH